MEGYWKTTLSFVKMDMTDQTAAKSLARTTVVIKELVSVEDAFASKVLLEKLAS